MVLTRGGKYSREASVKAKGKGVSVGRQVCIGDWQVCIGDWLAGHVRADKYRGAHPGLHLRTIPWNPSDRCWKLEMVTGVVAKMRMVF